MNPFLELYEKSKNPLENDELLVKIIKAYIPSKFDDDFYRRIQKIGAENKTSNPPPQKDKDVLWSILFNLWKSNILNSTEKINKQKYEGHFSELVNILKTIPDISTYSQLCSIIDKYPLISKYGILPAADDRIWDFLLSMDVNGTKEMDVIPKYRLYINSEAKDTYKLVMGFINKCYQNQLPYYLKFIDYPKDYPDRSDSLVIWADEKTLFKYITILNQLEAEMPNLISRCKEPPALTMKINDWIGFGEEPKESSYSYVRAGLLRKSIDSAIRQWIVENQDKEYIYGKQKYSIKQYLTNRIITNEFKSIKRKIQRNPRQAKNYGVELNELNGKLFAELCDELISEVIPVIKSGNDNIYYTRNGKDMIFCIDKRMKELIETLLNFDEDRSTILEKVRENIRLNSKQYGVDSEKFIFNDDYLQRIMAKEEFSDLLKKSVLKKSADLIMLEKNGGSALDGTPRDAILLKENGFVNLFKMMSIHINNQEDFQYLKDHFQELKEVQGNYFFTKEMMVNLPHNHEIFNHKYNLEINSINELNSEYLEFLEKEGRGFNKIFLVGFNSNYSFNTRELSDLKERLNEIITNNGIDINKNELLKFLKIYKVIGRNVEYEKYKGWDVALRDKKATCFGYSELLSLMLDSVGIESVVLKGESYINEIREGHAWNQVKINGQWYNCDLTWDSDRMRKDKPVQYCLRSDEFFRKNNEHINGQDDIIYVAPVDYNQQVINKYFGNNIMIER